MDERQKGPEQDADAKRHAESRRLLWQMDALIERAKTIVGDKPRPRVAVLEARARDKQ